MDLQDCAYDLADCMLLDPEVMKVLLKEFPVIRFRSQLKELLADMICG